MTEALTTQETDIAPILVERRDLLNLDRAHAYVASRIRARTPIGASECLELKSRYGPSEYDWRLKIAIAVCDLYRELFPRQYAASPSPLYSLAREQEFYLLADRHIFPLGDVADMIRREPCFFMPCITVKSMQLHDWRQGEFDCRQVETVYKLAQVLSNRSSTLTGGYGWRDLARDCGLEGCPAPARPLCAAGWQLFSYVCATSGTPLRYLPLAFHVTSYSTKTVYLDVPDGTFGFAWSKESVGKLMAERRQAERILASVATCDEWLNEAPRLRIGLAVTLWNTAAEIEAQSPYAGFIGEPGEVYYAPGLVEIYEQMEERL